MSKFTLENPDVVQPSCMCGGQAIKDDLTGCEIEPNGWDALIHGSVTLRIH